MTSKELEKPLSKSADPGVIQRDRRRPGRLNANPALIPLLRGEAATFEIVPQSRLPDREPAEIAPAAPLAPEKTAPDEAVHGPNDDEGNPARGIVIGMLLSIPLWGIIASVGYWLFS